MNLKRCLSMILSFLVLLGVDSMSTAVYAAATLGTESNPYQITTAKQLQDINNDLSGCYILASDIDLAQVDFAPIGGDAETGSFSGVFDGNGHTISNLNVFAGKYAGLFGCNEGVIKNVVLKDVNVYGSRYVGGVVAENTSYGTVSACTVQSGNVRSDGSVSEINIGGICGINNGCFQSEFMNGAAVTAQSNSTNIYIGGIIGRNQPSENFMISAINTGNIYSSVQKHYLSSCAGGLIGLEADSSYTLTIMKSRNIGDVSSSTSTTSTSAGGLVGYCRSNIAVTNSCNSGDISSSSNLSASHYNPYSYAGGLLASQSSDSSAVITNSCNVGKVYSSCSYSPYAGGLLGYNGRKSGLTITNSYNTGKVYGEGSCMAGGLIGYDDGSKTNIANSYNTGFINAAYNGGLIGRSYNNKITIEHSYNTGDMPGNSWGLLGENENNFGARIVDSYVLRGIVANPNKDSFGTVCAKDELISAAAAKWDSSLWNFDSKQNDGFPILKNACSPLQLNKANCKTPLKTACRLIAYKNGAVTDDVVWSVDDSSAKVTDKGVATFSKEGYYTVTAVDRNGNKANCSVYALKPATTLKVTNRTINISEGPFVSNYGYITICDGLGDYIANCKSSDDSVVSVEGNYGYLKINSVGTAIITATTAGGAVGTQKVTVVDSVQQISIPSTATIARGSKKKLEATTTPSPTSSKISWTTSDTNVATVDQSGNVTGVNIGSAVITAATDNGYSSICTVTVDAPVTSMEFERPSITVYKNDVQKLNLICMPGDTTDSITYYTSNSSVVSVSGDGTATAEAAGSCIITAKASSGVKAYCTVKVVDYPVIVTAIELDQSKHDMFVGEVFKLQSTITPSNATNKSVSWASTDETVATVSQGGTVEAKGAGKTVVTATTENGIIAYCVVNVTGVASANLSKIYVPNVLDSDGEYVEIPVLIEKNPGINFASLTVFYDEKELEPLSITNGNVFESVTGSVDKSGQQVKLYFVSDKNTVKDGVLAKIKCKILNGTKSPQISLCYFPSEIRNVDSETVAFNLADGRIDLNIHTHTWSAWKYNNDAVYNSSSDYKDGTQTRTCSACGESETKEAPNTALLRRRGNALSLESSITLATYITKDVVDYYDEVYAEFTRNGKTEKVYPSGKTLTSNSIVYCIFDYTGISPQALGDDVSITFYGVKDGVTYNGNAYKYSATDYIKSTLNKPTSSAKLKTLLVDLVYYGEACQVYQNYKTDNLLTDILTDEQKALRSTADLNLTNIKNASYETCENRLVKFGTALRLNNSVEIAIPLNMTNVTLDDLSFKVKIGSRTLTYTYAENPDNFEKGKDGYWYFYFDGVYANQMSDEVFITAYKGNEQVSYTLKYSVESYAATVTNAKLKAVTDAMMRYGNSAKAYAGK